MDGYWFGLMVGIVCGLMGAVALACLISGLAMDTEPDEVQAHDAEMEVKR